MPLAFVILAHRDPQQFARLIDVLLHPEDTFVLHIDERADAAMHTLVRRLAREHDNIVLLPPRPIIWGGPAMVETQIEAMADALRLNPHWTHCLNLTGQDFPIKSRAEMLALFSAHPETNYLSWFDPFDTDSPWRNAHERISRYHLSWPWLERVLQIPGIGRRLREFAGWKNQLPFLPYHQRRQPSFFRYYGGSNYVALTRAAVRYLTFHADALRIRRWLRASAHSDEIVFQSVFLASPLSPTLVNDTLREIDFTLNSPHPRVLTSADLPRLLASKALFARKFDPSIDSAITDTLAQRVRPVDPSNLVQI